MNGKICEYGLQGHNPEEYGEIPSMIFQKDNREELARVDPLSQLCSVYMLDFVQ